MNSIVRFAALIAACATLLAAAPAAGRPAQTEHRALYAASASAAVTAAPGACSDGRYNLEGPKWSSTLRWRFKSSTTPSYLGSSAALTALKRGFGNLTNSRNDCGLADRVSATSNYLGTTSSGIGVTKTAQCGASDGANTLGFGSLPSGILALTCVRYIGSRIIEADIRFTTAVTWTTSLTGCHNAFMLEAVATHEVGHAFGLGHVGETNHGRLTMSTYIDGTCQNGESSLGLGDVRGLRQLY